MSETSPSLRTGPIFEILQRNGVDFVLIGGVAGLVRGSSIPTFDLDVAYSRDAPNLERLAKALGELGVVLRGAPPDLPFQVDAQTLANGANFTLSTRFGDLDVLGDVAGISSYEDLRAGSTEEEISGFTVRVASIDHMIAMKRAANRPKDRMMLEEYFVLSDEERKEGG